MKGQELSLQFRGERNEEYKVANCALARIEGVSYLQTAAQKYPQTSFNDGSEDIFAVQLSDHASE